MCVSLKYLQLNLFLSQLRLRPVLCPAGHGDAGPLGGGSKCGSPDPQYPPTGGSVSLGCQLFLPEDPEKQSQQ